MQTIWDSSLWYSNPKAYWTLKYEYRRSGNDMQYRFYWKVWLGGSSYWHDAFTLRLFLNGTQYDVTVKGTTTDRGWSYEGTTGWYTVANKISGTVPFYAQMYNDSAKSVKGTSSSYSLNVSPAGATLLSAPNFTDEQNPTITYSNPAGNNVTSIQACISFDGRKDDIAYRDISKTGTSYRFVLTEEERNVLRNGTPNNTRTVQFFVKTVVGGTTFHSAVEKTLSIVNANPTFSASDISYEDANKVLFAISGNAADNQKIVQNKSSLKVAFGAAQGEKGASIVSYSLVLNGVTKTATASGSVSFGVINSTQNVTLSVTVKDSRGNTTTAKKEIKVFAWSAPTFTTILERLNNYEDETYLTVDAFISSVDGKNAIKSITYKYMESGGSYGSAVNIADKTKYTLSMDKNKAFTFSITVTDAFGHTTNEVTLAKGKFPLFIDTEKYAVGVNEFPAEGEALRVAGGVARFDDGIMLVSASKKFVLSVNDSGALIITEMK